MAYYITIEDRASIALYHLYKEKHISSIKLSTLLDYGNAAITYLRQNTASGKDSQLISSRDRTYHFIKSNSDMFELDEENKILSLKENINIDEMLDRFIGSIPSSVLDSLEQKEVLRVLDNGV